MKSSSFLDTSRFLSNPKWSNLAIKPAFVYIPEISIRQNLVKRTPLAIGTGISLGHDSEQGEFYHSDGTGTGEIFEQPFQLGSGHDFTYMVVYRFDPINTGLVLFHTQTGVSNRGLSFTQGRSGANGGLFNWTKAGVIDIPTGLPTLFRDKWHAVSITYTHATGKWVAVHRALGPDPNNFQNNYQTSIATGIDTSNFLSNTSGSWIIGANRNGTSVLTGDIAMTYFGMSAVPQGLLVEWAKDWRAPFAQEVPTSYLPPVPPAGRIMSSLAGSGGLAGLGGLVGQGGGLAG